MATRPAGGKERSNCKRTLEKATWPEKSDKTRQQLQQNIPLYKEQKALLMKLKGRKNAHLSRPSVSLPTAATQPWKNIPGKAQSLLTMPCPRQHLLNAGFKAFWGSNLSHEPSPNSPSFRKRHKKRIWKSSGVLLWLPQLRGHISLGKFLNSRDSKTFPICWSF